MCSLCGLTRVVAGDRPCSQPPTKCFLLGRFLQRLLGRFQLGLLPRDFRLARFDVFFQRLHVRFLGHRHSSPFSGIVLCRSVVMLFQKIPDEAPYFARRTCIEHIAQRYETVPVGCCDPDDQLAVLDVFLLWFLLVSHGIASHLAHIPLRHLILFVYTLLPERKGHVSLST